MRFKQHFELFTWQTILTRIFSVANQDKVALAITVILDAAYVQYLPVSVYDTYI
jgi:hypothetical protein